MINTCVLESTAPYTCVIKNLDERSHWIAKHILPHEHYLRSILARWKLPPDIDVNDIVQEVYGRLAAMDCVSTIRAPRAYMIGIARTTFLMHLRRSRVVSLQTIDDITQYVIEADQPSPEDHVSDREQLHLLAVAVDKLENPWRTAFLLRIVDNLTHQEIGTRLGMSANAVQKGNAKTLARLASLLGRSGSRGDRAPERQRKAEDEGLDDRTRNERGN